MMTYYAYTDTPAGEVMLVGDGKTLRAVYWRAYRHAPVPQPDWVEDRSAFTVVLRQLNEYFAGTRTTFSIELEAQGTPFQTRVWRELSKIAYGETRSYRQIAQALGVPTAARAVGAAVGRNPLSIVVPCHRVVAANGNLTGFAGGLASKRSLLELEGVLPGRQTSPSVT